MTNMPFQQSNLLRRSDNDITCLGLLQRKSPGFPLVGVLILAFYLAYLPHLSYPYPVHVDEWVLWAESRSVQQTASILFPSPFYGTISVDTRTVLETGYRLFLANFQYISGLPWEVIFRYLPPFIVLINVLCVFVLGRKLGFGWEAAFFTALIPTTVGILGPAFLVPVSLGLVFVSIGLFGVFWLKGWRLYLILFVSACFLLFMHAPSAICLIIILIPYAILTLKRNFKHSLGITLALVVPFLAALPWMYDLVSPMLKTIFVPVALNWWVEIPIIMQLYGYLAAAICLLGVGVLAFRGGIKALGLVLGLMLPLAMLLVFVIFHYGLQVLYQRGLMFAMMMMGIVGGAGLAAIKRLGETLPINTNTNSSTTPTPVHSSSPLRSESRKTRIRKYSGFALYGAAIIGILATVIPARINIPYYHMIDDSDYKAFKWIREYMREDNGPTEIAAEESREPGSDGIERSPEKAIVPPWKGTAFTAISEKRVFTRIHSVPQSADTLAADFLKNGAANTDFLLENGISIVYSIEPVTNTDLMEVRTGVYLVRPKAKVQLKIQN
jgi:hypothetical protein